MEEWKVGLKIKTIMMHEEYENNLIRFVLLAQSEHNLVI